jgi:DNA-binding transcriptional ArsR family regulator
LRSGFVREDEVVTGERRRLDYELDEVLEVRRPEQFRAIGDPTRQRIISLLSERAATTSQLAEALGQPKGSVGHHLKVLEEAGLIRVVRTRQVRAITEKYYGRTARLFFEFIGGDLDLPEEQIFHPLRQAMNEYVLQESEEQFSDVLTLRHARIPASRAEEFARRLTELADEFTDLETVHGERVYGLLAGLFLTDLPELPDEE